MKAMQQAAIRNSRLGHGKDDPDVQKWKTGMPLNLLTNLHVIARAKGNRRGDSPDCDRNVEVQRHAPGVSKSKGCRDGNKPPHWELRKIKIHGSARREVGL